MTTFTNSKDDVLNQTQEFGAGDILFSTAGVGRMQLPQLTEAQRDAISSPLLGEIIINTTSDHINYWNGSTWKQLTNT